MRRLLRILITAARIVGTPAREYVRLTTQLGILHLAGEIFFLVASWWMSERRWAWYGVVYCGVLGLIMVWRFTGPVLVASFVSGEWQNNLKITTPITTHIARRVSYWVSFVYMWALAPLIVTGTIPFWRYPNAYAVVMGVTLCVIYVVLTREGDGKFWRKVFYSGLAVVGVGILIACLFPQKTDRFLTSFELSDQADSVQGNDESLRIKDIEASLTEAKDLIRPLLHQRDEASLGIGSFIQTDQNNLALYQQAEAKLEAELGRLVSQSRFAALGSVRGINFSDEMAIFRAGVMLLLAITLIGGSISFVRSSFGNKKSATPSH